MHDFPDSNNYYDLPAPPQVSETGLLDDHVLCIKCGYDLFQQDTKGHCSECGRSVKETLLFDQRKPSDEWLPTTFAALSTLFVLSTLILTVIADKPFRTDWTNPTMIGSYFLTGGIFVHIIYGIRRSDRTAMMAWNGSTMLAIFAMVVALLCIGLQA